MSAEVGIPSQIKKFAVLDQAQLLQFQEAFFALVRLQDLHSAAEHADHAVHQGGPEGGVEVLRLRVLVVVPTGCCLVEVLHDGPLGGGGLAFLLWKAGLHIRLEKKTMKPRSMLKVGDRVRLPKDQSGEFLHQFAKVCINLGFVLLPPLWLEAAS